jgi:hypothetical protein
MFSPGDLVIAKTLYGEDLALIVKWAASQGGKNLWRVMIDGELSHDYFLESHLTIVSKVNA